MNFSLPTLIAPDIAALSGPASMKKEERLLVIGTAFEDFKHFDTYQSQNLRKEQKALAKIRNFGGPGAEKRPPNNEKNRP